MITVLISAEAEWNVLKDLLPGMTIHQSPFGEWGRSDWNCGKVTEELIFFHGGWGKIRAAASTQFAIDRFSPPLLINIGTCGGFAGAVDAGQILLIERTIVYDIHERMFDPEKAIESYSTTLDLDWIKDVPLNVRRSLMVSADQDLDPALISRLKQKYGAIAGDWESGAVAHICALNSVPCLIVRGVTDLVGEEGGEAYDRPEVFLSRTRQVVSHLVDLLPVWIEKFRRKSSHDRADGGDGR